MRVLLTVPSLRREFGGPTAKSRQLATALRELGTDVILAGCGTGGERSDRTLVLPSLGSFHGTPIPSALGGLRRLAAHATVVHVLGYRDPVGTAAAKIARRAGVRYVIEPVGMHRPRIRSLRLKRAFDIAGGGSVVGEASAVVATSSLEASELEEDGISLSRIVLRPNGIDVSDLLPLPPRGTFRQTLGIPPDAQLVLSLGRITAKKGLLHLVDAVAELDGVWLAVVGPDDGDGTLPRLKHRAAMNDATRVRIVPKGMWGNGKAAAFGDADVFCLPSATENFGNAAAEAAALGLPIVISDRCGVAEWLPKESSSVVPFGDIHAISEALGFALRDEVRNQARLAAKTTRSILSWSSLAQAQVQIYRTLLDSAV